MKLDWEWTTLAVLVAVLGWQVATLDLGEKQDHPVSIYAGVPNTAAWRSYLDGVMAGAIRSGDGFITASSLGGTVHVPAGSGYIVDCDPMLMSVIIFFGRDDVGEVTLTMLDPDAPDLGVDPTSDAAQEMFRGLCGHVARHIDSAMQKAR